MSGAAVTDADRKRLDKLPAAPFEPRVFSAHGKRPLEELRARAVELQGEANEAGRADLRFYPRASREATQSHGLGHEGATAVPAAIMVRGVER